MSIVTDGLRSDKWRPFAKQKLQMLRDIGLSVKNYVIDGYRISLSTMDDIDKARITAPPGAVVVDFTGGNYEYRYADKYGGDFHLTDSHLPAEGSTPRALFSGLDDIMYHGSTDFFAVRGVYGTLVASWYAPRAKFGGDPEAAGSGYLAGGLVTSETAPETIPAIGFGFTRNGSFYSATGLRTSPARWFENIVLGVVRATTVYWTVLTLAAEFPGFRGKAHFSRPAWSEDAAMVYVVHNGGACGDVLGVARVLAYYQESSGVAWFSGQVTQVSIATAFGLPAPCTGDGAESQLAEAMTNLLGSDGLFTEAPYQRGNFSYGPYDVCFWGPVPPSSAIKGVVFSFDGTVEVLDIVLPAYDSAMHQLVISEVSPEHYVCEVRDPLTYEFQAIYYGSPFSGWTALAHPPGIIIRHRTIKATATETKALALIYEDAAAPAATTLYEYDGAWVARGKVADGKIDRADVAMFGAHAFARLASLDSPVRALWI